MALLKAQKGLLEAGLACSAELCGHGRSQCPDHVGQTHYSGLSSFVPLGRPPGRSLATIAQVSSWAK